MEPTKEQFYLRRIAELEKQVTQLLQQIAKLTEQNAKLTEQVAALSKNSSNSSKPPSSDIVKPPKPNNTNGPRRQALIGYMKGALHASYSGLADFCGEVLDIDIARSHLCNTIARVNNALAGPYEELAEHVPTERVLNIDESGWKDKGLKYWIWVFSASAISFFWIAKSRGSKVLEEILGKTYNGTIVSDFFSAYVKYANRLQQFCLAHLIRDIKFLTTLPGEADQRFGRLLLIEFKRLFHFWHLRQKIPKDRFDRIMFRIRDRVLGLAEPCALGERSKSRTLARRLVKHGDAIFRFLFDPAVSPTNNAAERGIRAAVIDRRITQGPPEADSLMGRQWNARIWTVIGTCRKQSRSAWRSCLPAGRFCKTPCPPTTSPPEADRRRTPSLLPQPA